MFSNFSDISILVSLIGSKCRFDKDKGTSTLLFNLSLRKIIKQNFFTLCCGITFKIIFNQLSVSQMKFMQSKYTCSIKNKYKLLKKKKQTNTYLEPDNVSSYEHSDTLEEISQSMDECSSYSEAAMWPLLLSRL